MTPAQDNTPPKIMDALFGDLPADWRAERGFEQSAQQTAEDTPPLRPGAPASPWQLSKASWKRVALQVWDQIGIDRVTSVAGGVTFFGLLALFPGITMLVSLFGLVADRQTILNDLQMLHQILPPSAVELIAGQIKAIVETPASTLSLATIMSLLIAIYSANGGMKAMIDALNVAWYESETRGIIQLNLVSLVFTLGAVSLIIVMMILIAILPAVLSFLPYSSQAVQLLRWPLIFAMLLGSLAALYRWGPSRKDARWQWVSPGAAFASVALIIASMGFSWYASNFANYNQTYGSIGAAVVLMMWLWIASIVILVGAEVNSEIEREIKRVNGAER
ncbi:MAG: hypothetical protein DI498_04345 [Paracoccus denitrificans]|nr:MAG: hypothetical protein DI498_04345 [Paracoccus denitrificans]PZO85169.1 MAG: hypothetical protein DI633_04345 [Paracoccus denitrificans]